MIQAFCAAGGSVEQFWNSTFEEVEFQIRGRVDEWRIERRNAYNIHCSLVEKPVSVYEFGSLPFDEELQEEDLINQIKEAEENKAIWEHAKSIGYV